MTKTANTNRKVKFGEEGLSLVELMIASAVLMTGLISVVGVAVYVARTNSTTNTLNVMVSTAQDEADKLRNLTWSLMSEDPKLTVGGNLDYNASDINHRETISNTPTGTLNVSWKVLAGPGTTNDLRTLTIKVVQPGAPSRLADGVTITMFIVKG